MYDNKKCCHDPTKEPADFNSYTLKEILNTQLMKRLSCYILKFEIDLIKHPLTNLERVYIFFESCF